MMQRTTKEIGTIKNEEFNKMSDGEKEQAVIDYFFKGGRRHSEKTPSFRVGMRAKPRS
jgi:hypothetical protein